MGERKSKGIGDLISKLLREGFDNESILEQVKEQIPDANTSIGSINWHRNKLRSEGADVLSCRELNRLRKKQESENAE